MWYSEDFIAKLSPPVGLFNFYGQSALILIPLIKLPVLPAVGALDQLHPCILFPVDLLKFAKVRIARVCLEVFRQALALAR